MNRLALATTLGLAIAGCAHSVPVAQRLQQEEEKCTLVQTLLREPVPAQRLAEFVTEGQEPPVPVVVFVRKPEEGLLERFFAGESPECGANEFQVVRQLGREGLVLYLHETQEGYSYDAQRAGPEELSMAGSPQGMIRRNGGGGWVAISQE
jgi:hypothetical protein